MHAYTGKMLIQFRFHLLYQSFLTVACQVMNNSTVIVDDEKMNFFLIRLFAHEQISQIRLRWYLAGAK